MSYQLESLAQMNNYYSWILDEFSPYIGRRVLEIGAGTGNFSRMLLDHNGLDHLWLVEPTRELVVQLNDRFAGMPQVTVLPLSAEDLSPELLSSLQLDSIVLVNVLEHIEDDVNLLSLCAQALQPGGRILTFSPAFPILYSGYDRLIGHFRRYRKKELKEKFLVAGLSMQTLKYFNFVGFFAWLLLVRFLRARHFGDKKLKLYEKMIGVLQFVEQRIHPPLGQSVIAIGSKQA